MSRERYGDEPGMILLSAWADAPIPYAGTTGLPVVRRSVRCDRHRDGWCATHGGVKPSEGAWSDRAECGHDVTMRIGSEIREPDCAECRAALAAKESER